MALSTSARVHVTMPCEEVVGIGTFSSVLTVVGTSGLDVVSSLVLREEALVIIVDVDVVGSVIGFLLVAVVVLGLVVLRVTGADLTVEVLIIGFEVVGFVTIDELVFSSDSTENVVTSKSSSEIVVGSTFTMLSVGVGRGRGAFVVST